jgi:hypothetical protein
MSIGGHDRGYPLAKLIDVLFPPHMTETEQVDQLQLAFETSHDPRVQLLAWMGLELATLRRASPSKGYEPALVADGFHGLIARGVAKVAVRAGHREARESTLRRPVFDAIRFLAAPRQRRAILSRAKLILFAWNDTSIVETLFSNAAESETEFIKLLEAIVRGETADVGRLVDICAAIAPSLSLGRGPKVRASSAAHEFILESGIKLNKKRLPYARRDRAASNDDALTEATRVEFGVPDFDSRPSRRRRRRSVNRIK